VACGKEKPKAFFAFLVIEKWAIAGLDDRYIGKEGEVGDKDEVTKKD